MEAKIELKGEVYLVYNRVSLNREGVVRQVRVNPPQVASVITPSSFRHLYIHPLYSGFEGDEDTAFRLRRLLTPFNHIKRNDELGLGTIILDGLLYNLTRVERQTLFSHIGESNAGARANQHRKEVQSCKTGVL